MTTFYRCNSEIFEKCKKTSCQKECTLTAFKEYAMTDEFGKPIIATADDLRIEEPRTISEETTERYKPIILQEHDAEPRTMRAILDVETNDIYILETTKGFVEGMGMTIEEVPLNAVSN